MLHQLILVLSSASLVMAIFYIAEVAAGKFRKLSIDDLVVDFATFALPDMLIYPIIVFAVAALAAKFLPVHAGSLSDVPVWIQFLAFLVLEDMVNYWFHRAAHSFPKMMWAYHLAHHTPKYMSASMSHRNSLLYILAFPNQYTAALLVYLGFGETFVWYSAIKNVVLTAAHSDFCWDAFLYRYKVLHPLAWVIERTISTPATHRAHHAETEGDGIGHYNGNYSNLLFFWDVLFGTALISRKYVTTFGMPIDPAVGATPWYVLLLYPLFTRSLRQEPAMLPPDAEVS
jgi:sterol desaturase/sphingolipid hydroxylase (fatty acid hydroxylase superfamily)